MKGYLDVEQLKGMKREELQALAKELGVNAGGKNEEIIFRIAAVEVEVPENKELTEEEKETAKQAREKAEREADEQAAKEAAEQAAREATEKEAAEREAKKAAGIVTVKIVARFLDKQLNRIKDAGDTYEVSKDRASELVEAGVAIIEG